MAMLPETSPPVDRRQVSVFMIDDQLVIMIGGSRQTSLKFPDSAPNEWFYECDGRVRVARRSSAFQFESIECCGGTVKRRQGQMNHCSAAEDLFCICCH